MSMLDTSLITALLQRTSAEQARIDFFFFFFGGSGALGIGFAQVPRLLSEFNELAGLGAKQTLGGPNLDTLPLSTIGYPEPLKEYDIKQIIDLTPSAEEISAQGPKKSYMAKIGYLEKEGFYNTLPSSNPLAKYAVYTALSQGSGDLVSPQDVEEKLQRWRTEGLETFKRDLLTGTLRKYSALLVFAGLIALVLDLIVESGLHAFT